MVQAVVVTGLGIISPLGVGISENWQALSGPGPTDECSRSLDLVQRTKLRGFSQAKDFGQKATDQALRDAGLWDGQSLQGIDPERIGCTVSASKPLFDDLPGPGPTDECGDSLDLVQRTIVAPDEINAFVAEQFGLQGERRNVIAACATGAYSIALGASWIEQGLCDVVLAGSVEPYPHPLIEAGFRQMGVTSPEGVTRPFDQRRSGFTFGEGAGVVVLESERSAKRRRTQIYSRLTGWALGADSHSAVAFNSNGQHIANVIAKALNKGNLQSADVSHVHAHGTATRINDRIETQALAKAFGRHAERLMISATKASTGHLLGASGSVEFILTVLALRSQFIPPTATLEQSDPECGLDYTPRCGHPASFDHALSLSFGFGGPIGALLVSAC